MTNVIHLDYPSIMRQRIAEGDITWQEAFNWLQSQGMIASKAKKVLDEPLPTNYQCTDETGG